jgi:hypothetical protein
MRCADLPPVNHNAVTVDETCFSLREDDVMAAAVNNNIKSASVLPPPQSQPKSKSASSAGASFQQAVSHFMQNTTAGSGGPKGTNPSQTLSSGLMSSLLQMQG